MISQEWLAKFLQERIDQVQPEHVAEYLAAALLDDELIDRAL